MSASPRVSSTPAQTATDVPERFAGERDELVALRRDLHRHPELRYQEHRTAGICAERLAQYGFRVRTKVGGSGVVGVLEGAGPGQTVLLRADMDALPVEEATGHDFRSTRPGVMHACGHDAHVAIGLGVARRLAASRDTWRGTVKYVFQPAEEGGCGALRMIEQGVLEEPPVDAAFGLHVWNDLEVGTVAVSDGPVMASVDEFHIRIVGQGGHAARPHQAVDPIVCAAHVITAIQTIVSRNASPFENLVVSVTQLDGGTGFNVIPEAVELHGTVRTFGGRVYDQAPERLTTIAKGVAEALGCTATVRYERQSPPLINSPEMTTVLRRAAEAVIGPARLRDGLRTMGGEDFAFFAERVPAAFAFLGIRNEARGITAPLHSPRFDLDEGALLVGVAMLERAAREVLG
jgi:amidohydrolase